MKSTFIYLGILITMVSNSAFATALTNEKNVQESSSTEMTFETFSNGTILEKPALALEFDTSVLKYVNYKKTIEEVIAEDNKIIESEIENNVTTDIERVIKEDNQIIESTIANEVFPLDVDSLTKGFSIF